PTEGGFSVASVRASCLLRYPVAACRVEGQSRPRLPSLLDGAQGIDGGPVHDQQRTPPAESRRRHARYIPSVRTVPVDSPFTKRARCPSKDGEDHVDGPWLHGGRARRD